MTNGRRLVVGILLLYAVAIGLGVFLYWAIEEELQ